jgi:hypothetical protein
MDRILYFLLEFLQGLVDAGLRPLAMQANVRIRREGSCRQMSKERLDRNKICSE